MRTQQQTAVQRRTARIDRLSRLMVGSEIGRLPEVLRPDEDLLKVVSAIVPGGWGLLVATSERILWVDKGLISFRADTLDYGRITSVVAATGLVSGTIRIDMYGHSRIFSFVRPKDEAFPFGNLVLDKVEEAARRVIEAVVGVGMEARSTPQAGTLVTDTEQAGGAESPDAD